MNWSRQKPSSLITRVFSKFRRNSSKKSKNHNSNVLHFPSPNSSFYREGRFYSLDEDAYWRISFGDDRIQPRRSTGGINPLWQESDNDVMFSGFERLGLAEAEAPRRNFSEMVSDIKRMRESRGKQREKDERRRKGEDNIGGEGREIPPTESEDSRKPKFGQDYRVNRSFGDINVKTKSKTEARVGRKRDKGRAVKAYSPRIECKITALEEIRKARLKAKKRAPKERVVERNTVFDSFAVVKSSLDPHQDFKNSMVEMIREKGIGHPDDLEELLACYLTLNCDEYHDLIIRVFRQVWVELQGVCIDSFVKNVSYFDC